MRDCPTVQQSRNEVSNIFILSHDDSPIFILAFSIGQAKRMISPTLAILSDYHSLKVSFYFQSALISLG
jgi:hypothetical protein